jgi:hypothetical protein
MAIGWKMCGCQGNTKDKVKMYERDKGNEARNVGKKIRNRCPFLFSTVVNTATCMFSVRY